MDSVPWTLDLCGGHSRIMMAVDDGKGNRRSGSVYKCAEERSAATRGER